MPGTLQGQLFGKNRFRQRFQSSCHQIPYRFGVGRLGIFTAMAIAQDAVPDGIRFELLLPVYIIHLQRVDPVLSQISYPIGIESLIISGVVKMERIHLGMNALISGPMLSSRDQCSHLGTNALISGPMLSSRDQCSHLGTNALISGSTLSSRDQCSHLGINALISGSTLSSRDQCSHLGINALISGSMLSSRDQCSHLGIKALISGSMLSSQDQCSHLGINALISGVLSQTFGTV